MIFSVWDDDRRVYYYYSSRSPYRTLFESSYRTDIYTPWSDAKIMIPEDAQPSGFGEEPKGIIAHKISLERPACEQKAGEDWFWWLFLTAANWVFFRFPR